MTSTRSTTRTAVWCVEVIDADDASAREQLLEWLRTRTGAGGRARRWRWARCSHRCRCPADKQPYVKDVEGVDTRLTILWFTDGDSLDAWDEFAGAGDLVAATGLGRVELMAPFTPTLPGTDRYVDELRE